MPPKGRNKPTPMVVFMNEMREQMEAQHKRKFKYPFDEDLYVLCKPYYDELSEGEKQRYKDQAKAEWTGIRDDKNKKLTSGGIPVAVIEREQREKEQKWKLEKLEIKALFNFDIKTILPIEIVVIHVNWFCKVHENYFVPAEVALARFSLRDGLIDTYHCFPYHDFPPGSKGDSKSHSERTHQIPVFDFSEKTEKWHIIFRDIIKFLKKGKQQLLEGATFPLYTMNDDVNDITSRNAVRCFLNLIVQSANYDDTFGDNPHEKHFKLYSLAKLLSVLKQKDPNLPPQHALLLGTQVADHMLRQDMYLYSPKVACKWHDDHDNIPKCSLSRCISWVYIICDQSKFMGYPMIAGKHMPHNAVLFDVESSQRVPGNHAEDDEEEEEEYLDGDSEYDETVSVASSYQYPEDLPSHMGNLALGERRY